jgi:hypothetical protein
MLMGTEKCDWSDIKKPYVPDPICKSNLENTREWVDQAYRRLSTLDGANKTRRLSRSELKNLEAGLDAMKKAHRYAWETVLSRKIKEERNGPMKTFLNDINPQIPLAGYYLDTLTKLHATIPKDKVYWADSISLVVHGSRICSPYSTQAARFHNYCRNRKPIYQQRKDTNSSWAKMKNVTFTTKLKSHEGPLRELAKDGCVARS